jgi:Leucine-rich repeat (LRR) protein
LKNIRLHRNGQNYGPYSLEQILAFIQEGIIKDSDLAWTKEVDEWHPLKNLLNLESQPQIEGRSIEEHSETTGKIVSLLERGESQFAYDLVCSAGFPDLIYSTLFEGLEIDYEGDLQLPDWAQGDHYNENKLFFYRLLGSATQSQSSCLKIQDLIQNLSIVCLAYFGLRILPVEIFNLHSVKFLDLSGNEFSELQEEIIHMVSLKRLDLGNNKLSEIPSVLAKLENLEDLNLEENDLSGDTNAWHTLGFLRKIKVLNLSDTKVQAPKNHLSPALVLNKLNLSNNNFGQTDLSYFLDSLKNLPLFEYIDISSCKIDQIPNKIAELKALKGIKLNSNKIDELPTILSMLPKLESVELWDNPFIPEPSDLENDNILSRDNFETGEWESPGEHTLGDKQVEILKNFSAIIDCQDLAIIDEVIDGLVKNQESDLLVELVRGCRLDVHGNLLTGMYFPFPDWLEDVVTTLYVGENPREDWKGAPWSYDDRSADAAYFHYALIKLMGNLPEDDRVHPSLRKKNVHRLNLALPEKMPFEIGEFESLVELTVARGCLEGLPSSIGDLCSLRYLSLEENQISMLPSSLGNLSNLEHLGLRNNEIKELGGWISGLQNLKILDLAENQISELPCEIKYLDQLKFLGLRSNKLTSLPKEIGHLKKLRHLWLGGNSIERLPSEIYQINSLLAMGLVDNRCIPTDTKWLRGIEISHRADKIHLMAVKAENLEDANWILSNVNAWGGS